MSHSHRRLVLIGVLLAVLVPLRFFVFDLTRIVDQAMSPALSGGSHLVVLKLGEPRPGDVVTFHFGEYLSVGRVLAVAGQEVLIRRGQVEVDGKPLERGPMTPGIVIDSDCAPVEVLQYEESIGDSRWVTSHLAKDAEYAWGPERVPEGQVFVLPDHRFEGFLLLDEEGQRSVEPRGWVWKSVRGAPTCD